MIFAPNFVQPTLPNILQRIIVVLSFLGFIVQRSEELRKQERVQYTFFDFPFAYSVFILGPEWIWFRTRKFYIGVKRFHTKYTFFWFFILYPALVLGPTKSGFAPKNPTLGGKTLPSNSTQDLNPKSLINDEIILTPPSNSF